MKKGLLFIFIILTFIGCQSRKNKIITRSNIEKINKKDILMEDATYTYTEGKLKGVYKYYYDNGQIMKERTYLGVNEKTYEGGQLEGISRDYYDNGQLSSEQFYKSGKLEGISREFYRNGDLKKQENYKNGELNGISIEFYKNGNSLEILYKNNKIEKSKYNMVNWNFSG